MYHSYVYLGVLYLYPEMLSNVTFLEIGEYVGIFLNKHVHTEHKVGWPWHVSYNGSKSALGAKSK